LGAKDVYSGLQSDSTEQCICSCGVGSEEAKTTALETGGNKSDVVLVIGTDPPCVRCTLVAKWAEEAAADLGMKAQVKHLGVQDPVAKSLALAWDREIGTAKDVARKASVAVDWVRVQELAGKPWSPELDECLMGCKEKAEEAQMLMTPVLIVGGKLKHHGSVPSREQIRMWLREEFGDLRCC
jgi:protein-disulfide isomerase